MSEYKKIVLKGLEDVAVDNYQFRKIKSLLRRELHLTKNMQNNYDIIQMADLMEDIFPKDAGLERLIEVCQSIKELEDLAQRLKMESEKVKKQNKGKNKTAMKRRKQGKPSTSQSLSTNNESDMNKPSSEKKRKQTIKTEGGKKKKLTQEQTQLPEPSGSNTQKYKSCFQIFQKPPPIISSISSNKTARWGNVPKEPSKVKGYHRDPIEVMVLKVTEPFVYDLIDDTRMFHATVATETEFFRVKVFDTALKNKFIPQKIIAISDYFGVSGFLEIHGTSCVSDVNVNQMMVISNTLKQIANGTPKIEDVFSQTKGTYVNGEFVVFKKNERNGLIYYGIKDDTGEMEVVVYGRLTSIKCESGNKVQLICFKVTSSEGHQVTKGRSLSPDSVMKTSLEPYF